MIRMIKKVKSGQNDQFGQKLRKCQRTEKNLIYIARDDARAKNGRK